MPTFTLKICNIYITRVVNLRVIHTMYSDKLFFVSNHMHFSKTQWDHIPFEVEFKVTDLYNFTRIFSDFLGAK